MWDNAGRDCEYGNYRDMNNDVDWSDNFYPRAKERDSACMYYDEMVRDLLDEIAENFFGLDTREWGKRDYEIFTERVGI